jgi:transcriptional regulator with XRE-family HTH domain
MKKSKTKQKNHLTELFGQTLASLRSREGLSSAELAEKLGIGNSFVRIIESGSANFSITRIVDLLKILKFDYFSLLSMLTAIHVIESSDSDEEREKYLLEIKTLDPGLSGLLDKINGLEKMEQIKSCITFLRRYSVFIQAEEFNLQDDIRMVQKLNKISIDNPKLYEIVRNLIDL